MHEYPDRIFFGAFRGPSPAAAASTPSTPTSTAPLPTTPALDSTSKQQCEALEKTADAEAQAFTAIYGAAGKCEAAYSPDVSFARWRKLLYNACLNPICAITDLDTGRIRLADGAVEGLVRPAAEEIRAAAGACGVVLPAELVGWSIELDPVTMYNPPSMQVDVQKVRGG